MAASKITGIFFAGLLGLSINASADTNVALGKPVTLDGIFGVGGGSWGQLPLADKQTLTDGVFQPEQTQWNSNSIWWDANQTPAAANNTITIDLQGQYQITGFKVQADDNDYYQLQYWNGSSWTSAWDVPPPGPWGLVTSQTTLATPITTSELRFTATGGDGYYAVSEIQAFGSPVPVPATVWLFGSAVTGFGIFSRRNKRPNSPA